MAQAQTVAMSAYNVVIKDSDGAQQQFGVSASSWQNAVDAAKGKAGLAVDSTTDGNLLIVQWTGKLDITGE